MDDKEKFLGMSAYFIGRLHGELLMVRSDMHMDDKKNALVKVNDLIKLVEEKVATIFESSLDEKTEQA